MSRNQLKDISETRRDKAIQDCECRETNRILIEKHNARGASTGLQRNNRFSWPQLPEPSLPLSEDLSVPLSPAVSVYLRRSVAVSLVFSACYACLKWQSV